MNCKCNEICCKLREILKNSNKQFELALQDGTPALRKVKIMVLEEMCKLNNINSCGCFTGQLLIKINNNLEVFRHSNTALEYSQQARDAEIDGIFDKVQLYLNQ